MAKFKLYATAVAIVAGVMGAAPAAKAGPIPFDSNHSWDITLTVAATWSGYNFDDGSHYTLSDTLNLNLIANVDPATLGTTTIGSHTYASEVFDISSLTGTSTATVTPYGSSTILAQQGPNSLTLGPTIPSANPFAGDNTIQLINNKTAPHFGVGIDQYGISFANEDGATLNWGSLGPFVAYLQESAFTGAFGSIVLDPSDGYTVSDLLAANAGANPYYTLTTTSVAATATELPAPTTIVLLGTGLLGFGLLRRRKSV